MLIVDLSRMAGLRCPSEIGSPTWDAINWDVCGLRVLAKKTDHHDDDHAVRILRLLQNLRASCETDWVEKYPAHVVAPWLGYSPKVAAQHYLMSRAHHFEHVVNGGAATVTTTAEKLAVSCDAFCDAAGVCAGCRPLARNDRTRGHHSGYRGFLAGSREVTPVIRAGPRQDAAQKTARRGHGWPDGREMAGTGFEPVTSRL